MSYTSASLIPRCKKSSRRKSSKMARRTRKLYRKSADADAYRVLDTARAEEQAQTHIREPVEKSEGTTTWEKLKAQRSSDNRRNPSAKSPKLSVMDAPRASTTARDADTNVVPNSALPTGKNTISAKGRATLLSSAVARETLILPASDLAGRNKYPDPRRSFTKQLQTQKVAKQTFQSTTLTRSQYKLTLWKQRLKKPSLPRRILARNCPNTSPRSIKTRTNLLIYCMPLFNLNYRMGVQRSLRA